MLLATRMRAAPPMNREGKKNEAAISVRVPFNPQRMNGRSIRTMIMDRLVR